MLKKLYLRALSKAETLKRWHCASLFLLLMAAILFAESFFFPAEYQICGANEYTHQKECAQHHGGPFVLLWIAAFLDGHNGVVTAIATIVIATFTWTLSRSTKDLWHAGEKQIAVAQATADAAKKSADIAESTLIATNRPWVSVDISIGSNLVYDDEGNARVIIKFVLKNVGSSPAANVWIDGEIVPVFGDSGPFQKAISERNKARAAGLGNLGVTLFPGETQTHAHNLPISRASIKEYMEKMAADIGEEAAKKIGMSFLATLVGCVDYKFTFAEGHHQTGFILDLRKRDLTNPNLALHFDIAEGTIPAERLWLIQGFVGIAPD
jgi:hypothetical protein